MCLDPAGTMHPVQGCGISSEALVGWFQAWGNTVAISAGDAGIVVPRPLRPRKIWWYLKIF